MVKPIDPRPTIYEIMVYHQITIVQLSLSVVIVLPQNVETIVKEGSGTAEDIDACLRGLSYLTKQTYTRREVGGFSCIDSRSQNIRLRRFRLANGTPLSEQNRLREYEVLIPQDLIYPGVSQFAMAILAAYWDMIVPIGTYFTYMRSRMFEGRGVFNEDSLMILPLGLQVHIRLHPIHELTYLQIMGIYDPVVITLGNPDE